MTIRVDNDYGVFRALMDEVEEMNIENGWYDSDRTFGDDIALLHSEVSEALEAFRDEGTVRYFTDTNGDHVFVKGLQEPFPIGVKPEGVGSEFADVLVRLLDTCKRYDVDLWAEFRAKVDYNKTRGHRHGGKAL